MCKPKVPKMPKMEPLALPPMYMPPPPTPPVQPPVVQPTPQEPTPMPIPPAIPDVPQAPPPPEMVSQAETPVVKRQTSQRRAAQQASRGTDVLRIPIGTKSPVKGSPTGLNITG